MAQPNKKKGYAFVSNEWIFDERIKTELRLLIYISSLTAKDGYAFASNEHLAKEFNTTTVTISRQIAKLIDLGYLEAEYERYGSVIQKRYLRLTKMLTDHYQKRKPTVNKNVKDNNTSINTTSIISNKNEKNETLISECKHIPIDKHFLEIWNKARKSLLNLNHSNFNSIGAGYNDLKYIYENYTRKELSTALRGLFKQKGLLATCKQSPNHFLSNKNFEKYYDAGVNKIYNLNDTSKPKANINSKIGQI